MCYTCKPYCSLYHWRAAEAPTFPAAPPPYEAVFATWGYDSTLLAVAVTSSVLERNTGQRAAAGSVVQWGLKKL